MRPPRDGSRTRRGQRIVGDGLVPSRRALRARIDRSRRQPDAGDHKGRPYDLIHKFNGLRVYSMEAFVYPETATSANRMRAINAERSGFQCCLSPMAAIRLSIS